MAMPLTERNLSICLSCLDCIQGRGCRYVKHGINYKLPVQLSRKPQRNPAFTKGGIKRKIIKQINGESYRWCAICKKYLLFDNFYKSHKMAGGLNSYCKTCQRKYAKTRGQSPEKQAVYWKSYYAKNRDKINNRHLKERDKLKAHQIVRKSILTGKLRIGDKCENCGIKNKQLLVPHHDSYLEENLLKVRWLCRSCHRQHHKNMEKG
jgi:hypothetical protein